MRVLENSEATEKRVQRRTRYLEKIKMETEKEWKNLRGWEVGPSWVKLDILTGGKVEAMLRIMLEGLEEWSGIVALGHCPLVVLKLQIQRASSTFNSSWSRRKRLSTPR